MERRLSRAHGLLDRFVVIQCLLFLLPLLCAYINPVLLGNVRNAQILAVAILLLLMRWHKVGLAALLNWKCSAKLWNALGMMSLLSFLATGVTHYLGMRLNGEDFSIFDWMLFNTNHREFMTSPICNMAAALGVCHHFAIHPTYIMIPLALLHRIFQQPLFLIVVHSIVLWSAIIPLRALAKNWLRSDVLVVAVLLAYLGNAYVGAILNHGFHVEVFYVPLGLIWLQTWFDRRPSMYAWLLLFLSIKEDAAFYTLAFGSWQALMQPRDRRVWRLLALSLALLLLNLLVVQPYFLRLTGASTPSYLRFWGHLGSSKAAIIASIISHPLDTLRYFLLSHWYILFGSLLFIPLLSPASLSAMAPALLIYGLSNISHMREYATYYSAPLLPFLFFGLLEGGKKLLRKGQGFASSLLLAACLLFALSGGGYQKFPPIAFQALWDLTAARSLLKAEAPQLLCAETLLYPHLPYEWRIQPLSVKCMQQPRALTLFLNNSLYDSYPIGAKEFGALRAQVPGLQLVKRFPSGLEIYESRL